MSFVSLDSAAHFRLIERRHGLDVARERVAGLEPSEVEPAGEAPDPSAPPFASPAALVRDPNGGIKGRRKSNKDKLREAAARASGSREPS